MEWDDGMMVFLLLFFFLRVGFKKPGFLVVVIK